jgi:hypothetical protein
MLCSGRRLMLFKEKKGNLMRRILIENPEKPNKTSPQRLEMQRILAISHRKKPTKHRALANSSPNKRLITQLTHIDLQLYYKLVQTQNQNFQARLERWRRP